MSTKKKIALTVFAFLILLLIWEVISRIVDIQFAVPSVGDTFTELFKLFITLDYWKKIFLSLLRIAAGYILGVIFAVILSLITYKIEFINICVSIVMTILKSTPVASFIMIFWIISGSQTTPVIIATIMVMPIVWQNLMNGYAQINKQLLEVCSVFNLGFLRKLKILYFPSLLAFLLPTLIDSVGLAWKAGIAAEIITYTSNSIGREIFDAKNSFLGAEMFAWTITVIIFSLIIEYVFKKLLFKDIKYEFNS